MITITLLLVYAFDPPTCESPYRGNPLEHCVLVQEERRSWYEAEVSCNAQRGQLISLRHTVSVTQIGYSRSWVGARYDRTSGWIWADKTPVDFGHLKKLGVNINSTSPACLLASRVNNEVSISAADCSQRHPSICASEPFCPFQIVKEIKFDGSIGGNEEVRIELTKEGLIRVAGLDLGLGHWETPSRFVVESPAGIPCTWIAEFGVSTTFNTPTVHCGCKGFMKEAKPKFYCAHIGPIKIPPNGIKTPIPPFSASPIRVNPYVDEVTLPPLREVVTETELGWRWWVVLGATVVVSLMVVVGAVRRGGKKKVKEEEKKEKEKEVVVLHDAVAAEGCEQCQKFDAEVVNKRLLAVHAGIQEELIHPLNVVHASCEHTGYDHVHSFAVQNNYSPPSLGVLSTAYSRTKPRLAKNTRIIIKHNPYREDVTRDVESMGGYF